jgi:hypothetical protein
VGGRDGSGEAVAINDAGQSVGHSDTAPNRVDAVLWSPSGKATVLQDVGGRDVSYALAINNAGQSVGYSGTSNGTGEDAVLWSPSGKATVLQDVGGRDLSEAVAINDAGQSVGFSSTATGYDVVLWSPSGKATPWGRSRISLERYSGRGDQQFGRHHRDRLLPRRLLILFAHARLWRFYSRLPRSLLPCWFSFGLRGP